jgi:mannose-6-phosphate isomerase-like protein (cupin superfamily)
VKRRARRFNEPEPNFMGRSLSFRIAYVKVFAIFLFLLDSFRYISHNRRGEDAQEALMELKLTRWGGARPPGESELRQLYRQEGLSPYAWSNAPGDVYAQHVHDYHKVLYVLRGSITWILPQTGQEIETRPGDRLDLPRGTVHGARVGPQGVTCLEAHRG